MAAPPKKRMAKKKATSRRHGAQARTAAPGARTAEMLPVVPPQTPSDDNEMSQVFRPRHVHLRLLAAFEQAMQDGVNPTDTAIGKKLGVSRETINRWRRHKTDVWRWVHDHIGQRALELRPIVDRRVAALAISGSPEHTKLYYQFVAKVDAPYPDGPGNITVTNNFLVPRPDYAGAEAARIAALPASGSGSSRPAGDRFRLDDLPASTPAASSTPGAKAADPVRPSGIPVIKVRP